MKIKVIFITNEWFFVFNRNVLCPVGYLVMIDELLPLDFKDFQFP